MKRLIALLLATVLLLSLAACGNGSGSGSGNKGGLLGGNKTGNRVWYMGFGSKLEERFAAVESKLDPQKIYANLTYNEKMLYGTYELDGGTDALKAYQKTTAYVEREVYSQDAGGLITQQMSVLPVSIAAGPTGVGSGITNYRYSSLSNLREQEWALVKFLTPEGLFTVVCTFSVSGNQVTYTPVDYFKEVYTEEGDFDKVEYTVGTDGSFTYTFAINGPRITLTSGSDSLELCSYYFTQEKSDREMFLICTSTADTALVDGIDKFNGFGSLGGATARNGDYYSDFALKLEENGRLTLQWNVGDLMNKQYVTREFAYIVAGDAALSPCLILADEEGVYYYYESATTRERQILADTQEDADKLDDDTVKKIAETKEDLFEELTTELNNAGIQATVNRATGEIALDSTVLFGGDSAAVTEEGKAFLDKFLGVYVSVVYSEKYEGFIAKTQIEGHTAPLATSTYESGLPLSQERAANVRDYCLSAQVEADLSALNEGLEAVGLSNSKPIYNDKGEVDMEASRRVSFRFIVNAEGVK